MRKLTASDVTFRLAVEQDDTPVRGNALASGDDATDKACEDAIIARLNSGDIWAWVDITMTAKWECGAREYTGSSTLGCCSYADEKDFLAPGGYYEGMCVDALEELNRAVADAVADAAAIVNALSELPLAQLDVTG